MKRCKNCGACQECGQPIMRPVYPGTNPWTQPQPIWIAPYQPWGIGPSTITYSGNLTNVTGAQPFTGGGHYSH